MAGATGHISRLVMPTVQQPKEVHSLLNVCVNVAELPIELKENVRASKDIGIEVGRLLICCCHTQ